MTEDSNLCSICLSSVDTTTNQCTTACNHTFHTSCLLEASQTNPTCPLCRNNLLATHSTPTPYPQSTDIIIQNIIHAYRLDDNTMQPNNPYQNLSDVLTDIFTWQDTVELLNNLTPQHIENTPLDLSNNIIKYIIEAITRDDEYDPPDSNQHLINTLHNLLQYDNSLLLDNLNSIIT